MIAREIRYSRRTAGRRRGVQLTPMETRRDIIVRAAMLADSLGYEAFSLPEGWGLDSTLVLTEIALRTQRIKLVSRPLTVLSGPTVFCDEDPEAARRAAAP